MMYPDIARITRRLLRVKYQRVSNKLLSGQPKPKKCGIVYNGRFLTGTKSLHRTPQSRRWQMFWRMKNLKPYPI